MLKKLLSLCFLLPLLAGAQNIDVHHYAFSLDLSDATDSIRGITTIQVLVPAGDTTFGLDLYGPRPNGKGMGVEKVSGAAVSSWRQEKDRLYINLSKPSNGKDAVNVEVHYSGIPDDGLIISKNKWGDRTFFADNWPNRAHHWIPCNDRPDDKATFEFSVSVPWGYSVISNGEAGDTVVIATYSHKGDRTVYSWKEPVALSTKVMVIGAAKFAIKTFDDSPAGIPVSAWVYPQDSTKGFYDYGVAPSIVKFFSSYIAPFPYNKLANVQSKTIFGGMENASAIFYAEESVTGNRKWEDVIAHEIAHQWFGDMASEKSFAHLWLSEGFATYFTNLYIEQKYGVDSMRKRLEADRRRVINFAKANPKRAVVDSTADLMSLLNANSYQKGGWVLHMLRQQVGDSVFQKIIRAYYTKYKGRNADTRDFQFVADSVYQANISLVRATLSKGPWGYDLQKLPDSKSLGWFFDQWLYRPGVPKIEFKRIKRGNDYVLQITQKTDQPYIIPIILIDGNGSKTISKTVIISKRVTECNIYDTNGDWGLGDAFLFADYMIMK